MLVGLAALNWVPAESFLSFLPSGPQAFARS